MSSRSRPKNKISGSNNSKEDKQALQDAALIQQDTQDAIRRIQQQAAETEDIGATTLAGLEEQRRQMDGILEAGDTLHNNLDKTEKLQNKLSRWSLFFNRGAARRDVKEEEELHSQKEKVKSARQDRLDIQDSLAVHKNGGNSGTSTTRKGRRNKGNKSKESDEGPIDTNKVKSKDLLYGTSAADKGEHAAELDELATTDREIDSALDDVGAQLDSILGMSSDINSQVKQQSKGVTEIHDQVEAADYKQKVVNNRNRRFMTGKLRKDNEKEKEFGMMKMASMASKAMK
jgi:hypothetical protein